jgi:hypothetical protein
MRWVIYLAWAWLILIGYILITPVGPICIACGGIDKVGNIGDPATFRVLGGVSLALGIVGIVRQMQQRAT